MQKQSKTPRWVVRGSVALAIAAAPLIASADAVTDWNEVTVQATKGFNGITGTGVLLNSNLSSRIEAIVARAVFDAINTIEHFSSRHYYYAAEHTGSTAGATAQAVHDVLLNQLPDPAAGADSRWDGTRSWLDAKLQAYLSEQQIDTADPGLEAGRKAAAAALEARRYDGALPGAAYGALLTPSSNPGIGLWRQSNAGPAFVDPGTGAPTGFDAANAILGLPGIDLNWRDVTPFALSTAKKITLVAKVPLSPKVGSDEYVEELAYVKKYGDHDSTSRTADQTAQALYYKLDAELFVNEAARIASAARGFSLTQNAKLFALLDAAIADARFAAFDSKYQQKFWRPVTALNADEDGAVRNGYSAWHPLAATPSHPSNTAGHSTTGAAGFEVLRAIFGDRIKPDGSTVTLTTLPWLTGTNAGTGINTTREVTTFSQAQLENGASRLYLGVHFGFDNVQGQLLGLSVADEIIKSNDPAAEGLRINTKARASKRRLKRTLLKARDVYGYFGLSTGHKGPQW